MFDLSSMVAPKLKEMDEVIRRIYDKLIRSSGDRRTLLVHNLSFSNTGENDFVSTPCVLQSLHLLTLLY